MSDLAGGLIANTDVDAIEQIALIPVKGRERLNVEFTVAVASLTAFEVALQPADSASSLFMVVASATADYTAPAVNSAVRGASGDLTGAAAGAHWIVLDVKGVAFVRLRAAGANTTISGSWGAA
jgi:hypothetical protein